LIKLENKQFVLRFNQFINNPFIKSFNLHNAGNGSTANLMEANRKSLKSGVRRPKN